MKRSEAARYARWSAVLAFLLAGATTAIYLQRQWVAHVEKKHAPPPAPPAVERQSNALTFSKVEGNRTIFTVQASKSTDFKGEDASLLEDVQITVFGKAGDRHDVIHTQSCKYAKADGGIQCSGEVLMELQNAADAENARQQSSAPPNVVRVQTGGVTFERATGRAQTVQPVKFSFPNGSGDGIGAVYFSDEGVLRLVRDVHLDLHADWGRVSQLLPPEINSLSRGLSNLLLLVKVRGRIDDLKFEQELVPVVTDSLKKLWRGLTPERKRG